MQDELSIALDQNIETIAWRALPIPGFEHLIEQRFLIWHWLITDHTANQQETLEELATRCGLPHASLYQWVQDLCLLNKRALLTDERFLTSFEQATLDLIWLDIRPSAKVHKDPIPGCLVLNHQYYHDLEEQLLSKVIVCLSDINWQAFAAVCFLQTRNFESVFYISDIFINETLSPGWQARISARPSQVKTSGFTDWFEPKD